MAADFADVHFLGVGTPQKIGEYGADLRHVHAVIDALIAASGQGVVLVGKSTQSQWAPPSQFGTSEPGALARGVDVEIAWNRNSLREASRCDTLPRPYRRLGTR